MTKEPLISVVVPIYKVEPYLEKCIQSILKQTYKNLQVILVDDGSPDNCGKICDEYAKKDNRIEVIHKENGGLSDARNVGIKKARGEYIGFVDSDDYISDTMYEDMYNLLRENKAEVCICNFYEVKENELIIKNKDNGSKDYNKIEILKEILLDKNIQSYAWNKLYKIELFKDIQYPVGKKYEDIGTTFFVLEKCNKVVVTGKPEYYYLNRNDSIVNNVVPDTITNYIELIDKRFDYVEKKYDELKRYNIYYFVKTAITAYEDFLKIKEEIGEKDFNIIKEFIEKVKNIMKENKKEVINMFDCKQKKTLEIILNNKIDGLYKE